MENAWNDWKEYKKAQFKFSYKHKKSEDLAKQLLWEMADGKEKKVIKILNHTMANGWMGFVNPDDKKKGKYKSEYIAPLKTAIRHKPVSKETRAKGREILKSINLGKKTNEDGSVKKTEATFKIFLTKWKENSGHDPSEPKLKELKEYYFNKRKTA